MECVSVGWHSRAVTCDMECVSVGWRSRVLTCYMECVPVGWQNTAVTCDMGCVPVGWHSTAVMYVRKRSSEPVTLSLDLLWLTIELAPSDCLTKVDPSN
jgi:hypothetical protein